jgi:hypothetical protein
LLLLLRAACASPDAEWADAYRAEAMQKLLILTGLLLVAAGLAWPWLRRLPLGRMPGDIHVVRDGFSFSFPIVTCIVLSIVISLLLWLFRR